MAMSLASARLCEGTSIHGADLPDAVRLGILGPGGRANMRAFEHIILSCMSSSAQTGREIANVYASRLGVDPSPRVRVYTILPGLAHRGWIVSLGKSGRANRWALSAAGRTELECWLHGPGGRPPGGRSIELMVTLGCLSVPREDTGFLLRREISRLNRPAEDPLFGGEALRRRLRRRQNLADEVLGKWLRSVQASGCR